MIHLYDADIDSPFYEARDSLVEHTRGMVADGPDQCSRVIQSVANSVNDMCSLSHELARKSGWWAEYDAMPEQYRKHFIGAKLGLVHSEVSEAIEGHRKSKMDDHLPHRPSVEVELADAMIRIADLAGVLGLDLGGDVDHTPEHRASAGGKGY